MKDKNFKLETTKEELKNANLKIDALKDELKRANTSIGGYKKSNNEYKKRNAAYEKQVKELTSQISELKSDRYLIKKIPSGKTPNTNKTKISMPMKSSVRRFMKENFDYEKGN